MKFKEKYFNKHPNNNLVLLNDEIKNKYSKYIYVKDDYGVHKVRKDCLLKKEKLTIETVINKEKYLNKKFKNINIIKYNKANDIIVKTKYGYHKTTINNIINGIKQTIESAINKKEYFINRYNSLFKEHIYNFDTFDYIKSNIKTKLICKIHGEFVTTPRFLMRGHGCHMCAKNKISKKMKENPLGWKKNNWFNHAKKSKYYDSFKVYIIHCFNDNESFYKIGRTFQKTKRRFHNTNTFPYKYNIIKEFEFKKLTINNCNKCYNLETKLKRINKINKYRPNLKFGGMHECYSTIINNWYESK